VNQTEHRAPNALPLALAAARLGISPDALRMRINRGRIKGFKQGGRLFAVLDGAPGQGQRTTPAATEQPGPGQSEHAGERPASARSRGGGPGPGDSGGGSAAAEPGEPSLPLVVEFQKVELSRLLRDNSRLNQRFDQLMEELRHLREMQQREQVLRQQDQALRQQDQALRQQAQALIERLSAPPVSAPPLSAPLDSEAAASGKAPASPDTGPSVSAAEPDGAAPAEVPEDAANKAGNPAEPVDTAPEISTYAYEEGERRESAELADMLKDIGASLRGLDAAAAPDSPRTGWEPPGAQGDRRAPGEVAGRPSAPALGPSPGPAPGPASSPGPAPHTAPPTPAEDNEASLLEILGRMGPSAEERRTAARLMKRLLKGRAARHRGDPGDGEPGDDVS
jgi:hypothetical protein